MADDDLVIEGLTDVIRVGSGAFATIYRAVEPAYGRRVTVKVLTALDAEGRARFERERRAMGRVSSHPNIVIPLRGGFVEGGSRPYLITEFLDGGSMEDLRAEGPRPWDDAVTLIRPIADAVGHSHRAGVVHGDIKPATILLTGDGTPKLSDFGLSVVRDATATDGLLDSLHYAAPETFAPGGSERRDERSDLYSVAATLYALGTGGAPFQGAEPVDVINTILGSDPPPTGRDDLDRFFATALAKDPADRHRDAAELLAQLDRLAPTVPLSRPGEAVPTDTAPAETLDRDQLADLVGGRRRSRWRRVAGTMAAVLVGAALASGVLIGYDRFLAADDDPVEEAAATPTTEPSPPTTAAPELRTEIGEPTIVVNHGPGPVTGLAQLPDGRLASGGDDGTVRIWDPADPEVGEVVYRGHQGPISAVLALSDGRIVSATSSGGRFGWPRQSAPVHIWDPNEPDDPPITYDGHGFAGAAELRLLADGRVLSSGIVDGLRLWDPDDPASTAITITITDAAGDAVPPLEPLGLADGRIAIGTFSGEVHLVDPEAVDLEGTVTAEVVYSGHDQAITGLVELDDGRIVSVDPGGAQLWSPDDPSGPEATRAAGPSALLGAATVLDDGRIAIGSRNGPIILWTPDEPNLLAGIFRHQGEIRGLTVLDDGRLASASTDGTVRVWDLVGIQDRVTYAGHARPVQGIVALDDGLVATSGDGDTVQVWDPDGPVGAAARYQNADFDRPVDLALPGQFREPLHPGVDGRLVFADVSGRIHLWQVADPARTVDIGSIEDVTTVLPLSDGRLAVGVRDGTITIRAIDEPDRAGVTYRGHDLSVELLAELPDGRLVSAEGSGLAGFQVWDPAAPSETAGVYDGHQDADDVLAVRVLADGRVASTDSSGAVHLWDPDAPAGAAAVFPRHQAPATAVIELADGRLVSGALDGTVAIWDPADPDTVQAVYQGHTWVVDLAELADGRIASAGGDGLHLWLPPTPTESS